MTAPTTGRALRLLLDEQAARSLASVLTDLAGFFDNCHGPAADAVNDHFDDLAAADWIPIVLDEHARVLVTALEAAAEQPGVRPRARR